MWRQAIGRTPTLVEGQTNGTTPKANDRPWTRPWWQPSAGNGASLFYIVMIHALALVGLVLFPLPGWRVLAVALAVAAIGGVGTSVGSISGQAQRFVAGVLIWISPGIEYGGRCKFPSSYFRLSRSGGSPQASKKVFCGGDD